MYIIVKMLLRRSLRRLEQRTQRASTAQRYRNERSVQKVVNACVALALCCV